MLGFCTKPMLMAWQSKWKEFHTGQELKEQEEAHTEEEWTDRGLHLHMKCKDEVFSVSRTSCRKVWTTIVLHTAFPGNNQGRIRHSNTTLPAKREGIKKEGERFRVNVKFLKRRSISKISRKSGQREEEKDNLHCIIITVKEERRG